MIRTLLFFTLLLSSVIVFAGECNYYYQTVEITIYRNYDSVIGNYNWENEMEITVENSSGERVKDIAVLSWVYNDDNYASGWAKTPRKKIFASEAQRLPLTVEDGKINFILKVEDRNIIMNDEIINVKYNYDVTKLYWTTYRSINKNGTNLSFKIERVCN